MSNTPMSPKCFLDKLQDYFGGLYTKTQAEEVLFWANRRSSKMLYLIYRYCVQHGDTQYRQPPTVKLLTQYAAETREMMTLAGQTGYKQITDGVDREKGSRFVSALMECLREKKDPRNDQRVKDLLEKN